MAGTCEAAGGTKGEAAAGSGVEDELSGEGDAVALAAGRSFATIFGVDGVMESMAGAVSGLGDVD